MAIKDVYLDSRFMVSGKKSHIYLDNPFDLNKHIRSLINTVPSPGGNYTFENGLQIIPTDKVQLGGPLIQDTILDGIKASGIGTYAFALNNLRACFTSVLAPRGLGTAGYYLTMNEPSGVPFPLNGTDTLGLSFASNSYGAGYFLTEDGLDPRPYIVSEMNYGGGMARTAKIEFSNDYILNSHKIYDVANPSDIYKEYAIRYGDNQLSMYSINIDTSNPLDLTSNIVHSIVVSPNGIMFESASLTGTPPFNYTFPITSLTKPAPAPGHSMVLNSTGTHFDFVKDYKSLNHCFFNTGENVVVKTVKIPVMFDKYILESITVANPTGGGSVDLRIQKLSEFDDITVPANKQCTTYYLPSIITPLVGAEFISIEIYNITNPAMTQLSVTLNFLYAG